MAELGVAEEVDNCSKPKKARLEDGTSEQSDDSVHETLKNLSTFRVKRILSNNTQKKVMCVEGTFENRKGPAIVLFERKSFPNDEIFLKTLFNEETPLHKEFRNDVYGKYECFLTEKYNGLNTTIIHPATQKHIEKFQVNQFHIIEETEELYKEVTLPYLEAQQLSLEWVDNILEHKAEKDKIIYENKEKDVGFILISDLKWDGERATLHLLALPFQRLKSIRELNKSHLPLLKNIRDTATALVFEKYKIPSTQLRMYFHYQPTYYYLHVHICNLMLETPGVYAEKAHLLSTVINNIELVPDYYQRATLAFGSSESDPLYAKFQQYKSAKQNSK
ncbi:m7GpppX diphosphatase [Orussus abietinus]|uniref:m7GpppX diphosphatase n=1 Tax=Orussus abietinus TaxID=222816 RepID=UPI0006251A62|nr:m7GpppX diphosphatase [Orussus abietinus]